MFSARKIALLSVTLICLVGSIVLITLYLTATTESSTPRIMTTTSRSATPSTSSVRMYKDSSISEVTISLADVDDLTITNYDLSDLPTGLSVDGITGAISGTPTVEQSSTTHDVEVTCVDNMASSTIWYSLGDSTDGYTSAGTSAFYNSENTVTYWENQTQVSTGVGPTSEGAGFGKFDSGVVYGSTVDTGVRVLANSTSTGISRVRTFDEISIEFWCYREDGESYGTGDHIFNLGDAHSWSYDKTFGVNNDNSGGDGGVAANEGNVITLVTYPNGEWFHLGLYATNTPSNLIELHINGEIQDSYAGFPNLSVIDQMGLNGKNKSQLTDLGYGAINTRYSDYRITEGDRRSYWPPTGNMVTSSKAVTMGTIDIEVLAAAELTYPLVDNVVNGVALTVTPTLVWHVDETPTITIDPALPTGISLNSSTGVISGTYTLSTTGIPNATVPDESLRIVFDAPIEEEEVVVDEEEGDEEVVDEEGDEEVVEEEEEEDTTAAPFQIEYALVEFDEGAVGQYEPEITGDITGCTFSISDTPETITIDDETGIISCTGDVVAIPVQTYTVNVQHSTGIHTYAVRIVVYKEFFYVSDLKNTSLTVDDEVEFTPVSDTQLTSFTIPSKTHLVLVNSLGLFVDPLNGTIRGELTRTTPNQDMLDFFVTSQDPSTLLPHRSKMSVKVSAKTKDTFLWSGVGAGGAAVGLGIATIFVN